MESKPKVPITIITGFLGAGKTTFLNYILNENHGRRIVVVQNEFGEQIGLESAIVIGKDGSRVEEWLEFPNGCICCTVRDDLVLTLEKLVSKKKNSFDYLIIETTGMADPGPLAKSLWLDDSLESSLYLDAVITIVDAKNFEKALNEQKPDTFINEAQRQAAFGDVIVINKCDLVTKEEEENLEKRVIEVNAIAPRIKTKFSVVPLDKILNINAFSMEKALQVDPFFTTASQSDHTHKDDHCDHESHKQNHDNNIHTVFFEVPGSSSLDKLKQWFASIYWENELDCEIYRLKGFASIIGSPEKHIIQGVYDNFDIKPSNFEWGTEERKNKLVFIGKRLDAHLLKTNFIKNCL